MGPTRPGPDRLGTMSRPRSCVAPCIFHESIVHGTRFGTPLVGSIPGRQFKYDTEEKEPTTPLSLDTSQTLRLFLS